MAVECRGRNLGAKRELLEPVPVRCRAPARCPLNNLRYGKVSYSVQKKNEKWDALLAQWSKNDKREELSFSERAN